MNLNNTIGIFEAKTRFSQLCDQVNSTGQALLVERRGKALVMIAPLPTSHRKDANEDILTAWRRWTDEHPEEAEADFPDLSSLRLNKGVPPLG